MADAAPTLEAYTDLAELAGGFIHEIKNHLGTLSLNLELLGEDLDDPQTPRERRAADRVGRLRGHCRKLTDLANDFLRFARAHAPTVAPTALGDVVTRLVDFLTPTARARGIDLCWLPAPDLPMVAVDRGLFEQALLNLLLNAEQAMPDGGTLTLIGRVDRGEVCLDVIDTGCGMPADVLEKIFRPFHTTKQNGSGLGLPTAKKVIAAHGGRLDVQSEVGRGTKFTITLPAAAPPA